MVAAAHRFILRHREGLLGSLEEAKRRPAADRVLAAKTFETKLLALLQQLSDEFKESAVGPLRRTGDSPQELARLHSACGGALSDMENALDRGRSQGRALNALSAVTFSAAPVRGQPSLLAAE